MEIDSRDIEAAQQIIDAEGWPSRDRATKWLARILRFSADVASRHMCEAVASEREACAQMAENREDTPLAMRIRARGEAPR